MLVVPAILPASREIFEKELALLLEIPSVSRVQLDAVDGQYASPASWPFSAPEEFMQLLARGARLPNLDRIEYELDLMCANALQAVGYGLTVGATRFTLHVDDASRARQLLSEVKEQYGIRDGVPSKSVSFGIALSIGSDIGIAEQALEHIQYVQFMGIDHIGRQGEPFDERVFDSIREFHARYPEFPMQVDGGVSLASANRLSSLGISTLVVGSAILRADNPSDAFEAFSRVEGTA
ncbi:MAG: hypothetical protein WAN50_03525 [Minisyncoccia bacterium]